MLKLSSTPVCLLVIAAAAAALPACGSSDPASTSQPSSSTPTNAARADGLAKPTWALPENFVGRVPAGESIDVQVHLRMRNEAQALAELASIGDPDSPNFQHFLSDEEFEAKYAPTQADLAAVRAHLESFGLTVTDVPANRAYVSVKGSASQAEQAFGVELGMYQVGSVQKRAPRADIVLPSHVASRVSSVLGLATSTMAAPKRVAIGGLNRTKLAPKKGAKPQASAGPTCSEWWGAAPDSVDPKYTGVEQLAFAPCGYVPGQLRQAYGFNQAVRSGNDGHGIVIGIVDAYMSPTLGEDARTYAAQHDPDYPLTTKQFATYQGPGTPQPPDTGWYGEQTLDVEAVHAMAPGANIAYVGAQSAYDPDLIAAINLIVTKRLATIVSNSYGMVEQQGNDFVAWHAIAVQAGLKGIGLYFSSGDNGDESQSFFGPGQPSADFPASLDVVTAVGGTSLALDRDGGRVFELGWETGATFLVANSTDADAAPPPPAWDLQNMFFAFGAGGGTSFVYDQPAWQKNVVPPKMANVPGVPARVVPDVAMLADPITGYLIGQTDPSTNQYSEFAIGGTSLASPLFAGVMALAQQHAGHKLGFANATLYKQRRTAFRDIDASKTPEACVVPTSSGDALVTFDYAGLSIRPAAGYDNVTGIGVPNGAAFLKAIK